MNKDQYFRRKSGLHKVEKERPEKRADVAQMERTFIERAEKAVMEEVLSSVYNDPLLGPIANTGDIKTVAKLAAGRYGDASLWAKVASMEHSEVEKLAEAGLRKQLKAKLASMELVHGVAPSSVTRREQ